MLSGMGSASENYASGSIETFLVSLTLVMNVTQSISVGFYRFRRRLPKPPNGSGSSNLPSTSGTTTSSTSSTKTGGSGDTTQNDTSSNSSIVLAVPGGSNTNTTSSSNINNQASNPVTSATATLRTEILNGTNSKMATLPNKLRVQISATSNDDIVANNYTSFTRTLQSSSSLTSLPQSSATGTFRPILSSHHSTIESSSAGNASSNNTLNGISLLQSTGTTKLPIIGGQRNTIT